MKCLYCVGRKTEVKNSRKITSGTVVWRRRYCATCGKTFTTREKAVGDNLFVRKRNGLRQRFVYEKFFASIYNVLHAGKKRDSGDAAKAAKILVRSLLGQLFKSAKDKNVSTKKVIELTYMELRKKCRSAAFAYGTHSEYRTKTLTQMGLMV